MKIARGNKNSYENGK